MMEYKGYIGMAQYDDAAELLHGERGEEPDKPFSGKFMLRISPEQHRLISIAAKKSGKSLNAWVADNIYRDAKQELGFMDA